MNERQIKVLEAIVTFYIRSGRPAGSSCLVGDFKMGLCPASIRSIMAQLEEMGLVTKPHISAGRIPTEAGYRLYVDRFVRPGRLGGREVRAIQDAVGPNLSVQLILERVSRQLESLSHMTSVALLARRGDFDTYVFGMGNIVCEARDLAQTRSLLKVLENKEVIARALLGAAREAGVTVTIGHENPVKPMKSCSVVSSPYRVGTAKGAVGVIGPLRMEYARIMTLIDFASKQLTHRLAKRGGRHQGAN